MVRLTDRLDLTIVVDWDFKSQNKQNQKAFISLEDVRCKKALRKVHNVHSFLRMTILINLR